MKERKRERERESEKDGETANREVRMKRRYNGLRDRELITHKSQIKLQR